MRTLQQRYPFKRNNGQLDVKTQTCLSFSLGTSVKEVNFIYLLDQLRTNSENALSLTLILKLEI